MGASPGFSSQLASAKPANERVSAKRIEVIISRNIITAGTAHLCHVLLVRDKSQVWSTLKGRVLHNGVNTESGDYGGPFESLSTAPTSYYPVLLVFCSFISLFLLSIGSFLKR